MQCGITQGSSEITYLEIEIIDVRKSDTWSPYLLSFRWELLAVNGTDHTNLPVTVGTWFWADFKSFYLMYDYYEIVSLVCLCMLQHLCNWMSFLRL